MAAVLHDSVVTATVVRTLLREIQLTVTTMRNSMHGFPFLSDMSMGLRLVTLRAAKAPLKHVPTVISSHSVLLRFKFLQIVNCDKHVNIQLFAKVKNILLVGLKGISKISRIRQWLGIDSTKTLVHVRLA